MFRRARSRPTTRSSSGAGAVMAPGAPRRCKSRASGGGGAVGEVDSPGQRAVEIDGLEPEGPVRESLDTALGRLATGGQPRQAAGRSELDPAFPHTVVP